MREIIKVYEISLAPTKKTKILGKAERMLFVLVKRLFPDLEVYKNFKHPDLLWKNVDDGKPKKYARRMELDLFCPALSLAFEYQGEQHFDKHFYPKNYEIQKQKDEQKKQMALSAGITLIQIPFWWDGKLDSLCATIEKHKPGSIRIRYNGVPMSEKLEITRTSWY
jgi:hypothetical protein